MFDTSNLRFLCKYKSGSYLYGTNTENSDIDWCGVYLDNKLNIQNYSTLITCDDKTKSMDEKFCELKTWAEDVINGDFFKLEPLLINNDKLVINSKEWQDIKKLPYFFINSEGIFKWVINYCYKESFWANSKVNINNQLRDQRILDRFNAIGFDNAAFGHAILTATRATWFFTEGTFYTDVSDKDKDFQSLILKIKQSPLDFKLEELNNLLAESINNLRKAFSNRIVDLKPNLIKVNDIIQYYYH